MLNRRSSPCSPNRCGLDWSRNRLRSFLSLCGEGCCPSTRIFQRFADDSRLAVGTGKPAATTGNAATDTTHTGVQGGIQFACMERVGRTFNSSNVDNGVIAALVD